MNKSIYSEHLYISIFILWYGTEIIFSTTLKTILGFPIDILNNIVSWLIFALLMAEIVFFQSYKKRELVVIVVVTLPIIIAAVLSGYNTLLSVWMFIVGAKNISFDRIIQIAYKILLIMIPMVIFLRLVEVIEDYTIMRGNIVRYSLGFSHPNQLGIRIFQLIVCHCFMNRDKLRIRNFFSIFVAIIFTIIIPNSKTAYISLSVLIILLLIYKYFNIYKMAFLKLYAKILVIGALLLNGFSIFLSYINVNEIRILSLIDKWMSSRFSLGHIVWSIYGVSFWGQRIYISEAERQLVGITGRLWLDNAYVMILLRYGILVFLIISVAYLILLRNKTARKEYVLVIILFLYSLYGVMENGLFALSHNIFLIAFADLLYNKKSQKEV